MNSRVFIVNAHYFLDARDEVQKKTFTKWVNKYLAKVKSLCWCKISAAADAIIITLCCMVQLHTQTFWKI